MRKITFGSLYPEYRLVMIPATFKIEGGVKVPIPGKAINFSGGIYTTSDKDEINFLKKHRDFGTIITIIEEEEEKKEG